MAATEPRQYAFVVRYRHNGEVIDVTSRGESGEDAFKRFVERMKNWGKSPREYRFVSARQVPSAEES